jgi:leucyl aminopeptidase
MNRPISSNTPLKITARSSSSPFELEADVLVLGTWTIATAPAKKKTKKKTTTLVDTLESVLGGSSRVIAAAAFEGKKGQALTIPTLGRLPARAVALVGLGDRASSGPGDVRTFAATAARIAKSEKAKTLVVALPDGLESELRVVAEGLELGAYRFTKYLTGDRRPKETLEDVTIVTTARLPRDAKRAVAIGQGVAAGVIVARDLSNEPPNEMFPQAMAEYASGVARRYDLDIVVFDEKEIEKRGMRLLHAVGRGSARRERLVHVSYAPKKRKPRGRYVFIGKGITFDTGGVSIKPAAGMGEMKHDMSGAANVLGLMVAVATLEPDVEVHAILACAENMADGNSYRPGDVWESLDGKSVEIINTDAEGRLALADAFAYAAKTLKPDLLVDNATLTGAQVVALGTTYSAFYASNDETSRRFANAARAAGEQTWRMPLIEDLRDQLKSDVADLKHMGDRYGGSITAALFLREFIGDTKDWIHVDIAGPAQTDRPYAWHDKGATGHIVLTFVALVEGSRAEPR